MSLLCVVSAWIAFTLFGLSTDRHYGERLHARPSASRRRWLRIAAWSGVILSGLLAFWAKGAVYGAMFALGALSFGAATAFLSLNLVPARRARPLSKAPDVAL